MKVALTAAERTRLRQTMKRAASARLYRRLQAVLLAGEGHSAAQIAAVTGASVRSVRSWCATWRACRQRRYPQKVLAEKPRLGRHPAVLALDRARLLSELARDPLALGYAATNWMVPLLAAHLRRQGHPITARTLRRRLHAAGLRWKRPRLSSPSRSRTAPRKKGACPYHKDLARWRAAWALRGKQAEVRTSGKNARRSLFGTVDLRTGRRVLMVRSHQRLADYHGFCGDCATAREPAARSGCSWIDTAAIAVRAVYAWPKSWASACSGCRANVPNSTRSIISGAG